MWLLHQHCSCAYVCLCSCVGEKNAKSPRVVIVTSPGTALYPRAGEAERQPVLREEERALLQHFWNCSFQQCIYPPSNHLFIPTSSTISCFLSLCIGNITLVFTLSPPTVSLALWALTSVTWSLCVGGGGGLGVEGESQVTTRQAAEALARPHTTRQHREIQHRGFT